METPVQFTDVLRTEVVRCKSVYREARIKGVFIDGSPTSFQSAVRMFCGREHNLRFLEIARDADPLLQQTRPVPSSAMTQTRKRLFDRSHRTGLVVAKLWDMQGKMTGNNNFSNQKQRDGSHPKNWRFNDGNNQKVMHCRVSLAQDHVIKSYFDTVCLGKWKKLREASYHKMTNTVRFIGGHNYTFNRSRCAHKKYGGIFRAPKRFSHKKQSYARNRRFSLTIRELKSQDEEAGVEFRSEHPSLKQWRQRGASVGEWKKARANVWRRRTG